jgi:MFS family permease
VRPRPRPRPQSLARPRLFVAFAHRPFALLWGGQTLSRLGDGIEAVALAWWVLEETGSAAAMGTLLVCASVPELAFLLVGGVAVDRLPRLRLMLVSDLLRGGLMAFVALLAWREALALWHLFGVAALFGLAAALFAPAYTAVVPDLLPAEALPSANSLRSLGRRFGGIAGPVIGGTLVAVGGSALAFALDAVSFLVAALFVALVARRPVPRARPTPTSGVLGDLRDGVGTVLGAPWLWIPIATAGLSSVTLASPLAAALPLLVDQELDAGVGVFSLLSAASAAGAIVTAIWLGRQPRLGRKGSLTYGCWLVAALALAAMGLPIGVVGVGLAIGLYGAAETGLMLAWMNVLQEKVPPDRLGRVASIDALGSSLLLPAGYAAAGLAADRFGAGPVFVAGGAFSAAVIGLGWLHPAIRRLD